MSKCSNLLSIMESRLNEAVSGELAAALNNMTKYDKSKLVSAISSYGIDFNRSVDSAEEVKKNDPRLKQPGIIIGIYHDGNDNINLVAYDTGKNKSILDRYDQVKKPNGEKVLINDFGKLPWAKWLDLMSSVYVLNKEDSVSERELRSERYKSKKVIDDLLRNPEYNEFLKKAVSDAGFEIDQIHQAYGKPGNIQVTLKDPSTNDVTKVRIEHDPYKKEFTVRTWSHNFNQKEVDELMTSLQKARKLLPILNSMNISKLVPDIEW